MTRPSATRQSLDVFRHNVLCTQSVQYHGMATTASVSCIYRFGFPCVPVTFGQCQEERGQALIFKSYKQIGTMVYILRTKAWATIGRTAEDKIYNMSCSPSGTNGQQALSLSSRVAWSYSVCMYVRLVQCVAHTTTLSLKKRNVHKYLHKTAAPDTCTMSPTHTVSLSVLSSSMVIVSVYRYV